MSVRNAFAAIRQKLRGAVNEAARVEVAALKDDLGVPIEYPAGGAPLRSMPGDPPRRGIKSHPLQDSIKAVEHDTNRNIGVAICAGPVLDKDGRDYAVALEFGSYFYAGRPGAPRPFMRNSMMRMARNVGNVISRAFTGWNQ